MKTSTYTQSPREIPATVITGFQPSSGSTNSQELIFTNETDGPVRSKFLIALDIDGTLMSHSSPLSAATRSAVQAVIRQGHHVVLATGRTRWALSPILEKLGLSNGIAICSNGAVTLEVNSSSSFSGYQLSQQITLDADPVLIALKRVLPQGTYTLEEPDGTLLSTERFTDPILGKTSTKVAFESLFGRIATRVIVTCNESTEVQLQQVLDRLGFHGVTYTVGSTAWLDVSAHGVSKASALERIRQFFGVCPSRTIAIGDGRNDIEMLRWASRGVAMGQSPPEVIAASDEVTLNVENDGAARILLGLLQQTIAC